MKQLLTLHKIPLLLFLASCAFYWAFAFDLDRTDLIKLFGLYGALFFLSWKLLQLEKDNFKLLFGAAIVFRLIFLFAMPNLSQDFYRFIWDGKLMLQGINPYLVTPDEFITNPPIEGAKTLYNSMGELSAGNPTNYPPLNQLFFALAALLGGNSIIGAVVSLRLFIIAADVGIYYFGRNLLKKLNLPENRIFWYLLNPFIIIELTGNLHFEGVMVLFLLASLYFLQMKKWVLSSILFACSVSVKLIPLLFLPLLFRYLKLKKALAFYGLTSFFVLLFFLPFLSEAFFTNYTASVGLWFQKFEFNASIYYLIRWIGFRLQGYNIIHLAGPVLGIIVFLFVILLSFHRRNKSLPGLLTSMLFSISVYLFLATTVHPWYLVTPLLISIFTGYRFVPVWSLLIVLSYSAYAHPAFEENLWLVALEYLVVFGFMGYEVFKRTKNPIFQAPNSRKI
ncbi:polyprenol phosphomannose-dependent alpha 1,6 mannosyltransferase MptB [Salinimicrobium flavum]|uniref:Polyprenol phosphomannose-dependent alpha 1,6 mannosyltransferase MptB n=1 Tax=Salinimicrobium flavum TaxID=1737065 RepID=A0ABW5IU91_9FLAO